MHLVKVKIVRECQMAIDMQIIAILFAHGNYVYRSRDHAFAYFKTETTLVTISKSASSIRPEDRSADQFIAAYI